MRGALQTCKSQNVIPPMTTSATISFLAKLLASLSGMSKQVYLAILNAYMKSTENINSIKVPTCYYQKTQQRYTKFSKI